MSYIPNPRLRISQFGNLVIAERTPIVELKSIYGISDIRDVTTTAGSGTVTHAGAGSASEFTLATTASGTDLARLESAEHGRYQPGSSGECGIGVRLASSTLTGNQDARWGLFEGDEGVFFGLDATGLYVATRKGGTDAKVYQSNWNADKLDGTGPSGLTLDLTEGNVFQIDFTWYGYGVIEWAVVLPDANGVQRIFVVHRFSPTGATSINNPNLPIAVEISNGGTATAQTMYVGGRQYSILGRFEPNRRANGHYISSSLGSIGTTFLPVISFRRKTNFEAISARVEGFDMFADANLYWQLRVNGSLTGASWGTPADTTATETCMEVDTSATAISGGDIINPGGIVGASSKNSADIGAQSALGVDVPENYPVTLCVRRISGTNATVEGCVLRWREEW